MLMNGIESTCSGNTCIRKHSWVTLFLHHVHLIPTVCIQLILNWQPTDSWLMVVCSPALQMDFGSREAQLDQSQSQSKLTSGWIMLCNPKMSLSAWSKCPEIFHVSSLVMVLSHYNSGSGSVIKASLSYWKKCRAYGRLPGWRIEQGG